MFNYLYCETNKKSAITSLQKKLNESVFIERKQLKKLKSALLRVRCVNQC